MTEIDAAADGPTPDAGGPAEVNVPSGETPPDSAYPREAIEARAKLVALAANPPGDEPEAAATPDEPASEPDAPVDDETQALKDLKAKYGGDLNKMAESYWEGSKQASTLHRELEAMRASIERLHEEKAPVVDLPPESAPSAEDLRFVTDDIATFESDIEQAKKSMDTIIDRADDLKAKIARAEGRAEAAEDPDQKARVQAEIRELTKDYNEEVKSFKAAQAAKVKTERDLKVKQREKVSIERRIETERQQFIKAQADQKTKIAEQGQAFSNSVETAFKATGLPESERALYGETLTAKVSAYLRSLGNTPALTTEGLIKVTEQEAAKLAKLNGLGKRQEFANASAAKLAANAALKATPAPGTGAGLKPPKFTSAEEEGRWYAKTARERLAAAAARSRGGQA